MDAAGVGGHVSQSVLSPFWLLLQSWGLPPWVSDVDYGDNLSGRLNGLREAVTTSGMSAGRTKQLSRCVPCEAPAAQRLLPPEEEGCPSPRRRCSQVTGALDTRW